MTTPFFDHDDEYDDIVHAEPSDFGCTWCLGRFAPAGTHPILGLVYVACMYCTELCTCCGGIGIFPADTTCIRCLTEALTELGYVATFCHTCAGILTVQAIHTPIDVPAETPDDDPPWEEDPL